MSVFRTIVAAVDFSASSGNALRNAAGLIPNGGLLTVAHVLGRDADSANWTAANAALYDRQTLDQWLRDNTSGSDEFMAVAAAATEAIFGGEAAELSLLYTLFYIAASGNEQNVGTFERNFNTADGAQERRFDGQSWLAWRNLRGSHKPQPLACTSPSGGRIDCFAVASDSALEHIAYY